VGFCDMFINFFCECIDFKKLRLILYLFVYFSRNSGDGDTLRFAYSNNRFEHVTFNNNQLIISSQAIASTEAIRDPHILRG
jgi:hypothetical protein